MRRIRIPIRRAALVAAAACATIVIWVVGTASWAQIARAHGKELSIFVSSLVPDESEPLRRLFRVEVVFANDFDPVEDGEVVLSGFRKEGGENLGSVELVELVSEPGVYVGEVVFSRFGEWNIDVNVRSNFQQGEGTTQFVENVRPVILSDAEEASLASEAARVRQLQLFFSFGWWPDVISIILRVTHSLSGAAYAGAVGIILLAAWLGRGGRSLLAGKAGRYFLPVALASLAGILLSGMYGAAFDAPNGAPGIYDVRDLLQLPYANAYLAAFLLKPLLWIALVFFAFRIHTNVIKPALNPSPADWSAEGGELFTPSDGLRRLTHIGATIGILLVADLAVLIYIHYISHLGVFVPPSSYKGLR